MKKLRNEFLTITLTYEDYVWTVKSYGEMFSVTDFTDINMQSKCSMTFVIYSRP